MKKKKIITNNNNNNRLSDETSKASKKRFNIFLQQEKEANDELRKFTHSIPKHYSSQSICTVSTEGESSGELE